MKMKVELTKGPIFQKLILFSMPMIAGNLLQQIYNLVDTFVVGRYISADALAADEKKLKEDIRLSFLFILAVSVVIYLIIYPGMECIQNLLQTPVKSIGMMWNRMLREKNVGVWNRLCLRCLFYFCLACLQTILLIP